VNERAAGSFTLAPADYAELVRRLVGLRSVAQELIEAFDDADAATGATEMLGSIDRALDLLEYGGERTRL
jgi:hypothetical protein